MNIVVIYGTERKGSTYNITQLFLEKLVCETSEVTEFFLPRDMPHFCLGCGSCFGKGEEYCPHYKEINPIKKVMEEADLIVFASPVYVYHISGQMKTFLDHFGFQWMVHRPSKAMFSKMALVISTAAGAGMKSTNKDITDSLNFWGVGKIFTYGKAVAAVNWQGVNEKKKLKIEKDVEKLSAKILRKHTKVRPSIKVKALFHAIRFSHKKFNLSKIDKEYWEKQGWLKSKRPW